MAVMSNLVNVSSFVDLENLWKHTQNDDVIFLALLLFTGFFYATYIQEKPDPYHHVWFEKPQATDANANVAQTRDIGVKLEESKKDVVVFWGSQSGTAEGFANRLVQDCRRRFGLDALAADLQDYDPESIANIPETKIAVFIVSTYGEGDPSDNATHFLSWLESNKLVKFSKLRYAAFGLGNKNYKFYNRVVDVVDDALNHAGATSLMPTGKADNSNGATDEDFIEWKQALFSLFRDQLGFAERPVQYEATLKVVEDTSLDIIDLHDGEPVKATSIKKGISNLSGIHPLPINSATKLLSTTDRNCLHMELDTAEFPELKYRTGDHIAVWPSNPTSEVERLLNILGLQARKQTPLLISSLDPAVQVKVPSPTTWEALIQNYLDICAPVPREVVLTLAQFAPCESSKATLQALGEDKDAYHDYCSKNHVTFGRLLENVSSATDAWLNVPLSFVLDSLPTLSPRSYSISSSSIVSPKKISITVATSSASSSTHSAPIPGLTTNYLLALHDCLSDPSSLTTPAYKLSGPNNALSLPDGHKLYAHIQTSKFRLPTSSKHPLIMIAAGSGIAPFRAFLHERARLASIGREVGASLLFFGCRSPDEYLYQEELEELQKRNAETGMEVVVAFSRTDGNREGGRCYVQDRVEERAQEVSRLLAEEGANLYICGSAAMARDVAGRLETCLRREMAWDEARWSEWSEGMRRAKRWQEDVWG